MLQHSLGKLVPSGARVVLRYVAIRDLFAKSRTMSLTMSLSIELFHAALSCDLHNIRFCIPAILSNSPLPNKSSILNHKRSWK